MSKRILVADDDPLMRTFVAVCLQDLGEIRQAGDGKETLSALADAEFDLLLLDWDMPAPDGLAVLKTIRSRSLHLPVIMVTAEAGKSRVVAAIRAGASDYLVKPFQSVSLREKVRKLCEATVPAQPGGAGAGRTA
jgi:two-component system chemotaxis response regulator CheY